DAGESPAVAGEVLEVDVAAGLVPAFEVVIDDRQHEDGRLRRDVLAREALLDVAVLAAAVAADDVAVVALLAARLVGGQEEAVAARRGAGAAARRTHRLEPAER